MKVHVSFDGKQWIVRLDNGLADASGFGKRVGWEAVVFETQPPGVQRVVYRPAGWLEGASRDELARALTEADPVRTRWESMPDA